MSTRTTLLAAALFCVGWTGCREEASPSDSNGVLKVVCTTGQVGDLLHEIGGTQVQVQTLMGPGVDPHLYKPTPGDTAQLRRADAVFYSGLHLEGRLAELLAELGRSRPVYAVSEPIEKKSPDRLRQAPGFGGVYDPHFWFDVALWREAAAGVAERLAELRPAHAAEFRERALRYDEQLKLLEAECRQRLEQIPKTQRVMVTAHDAFEYFGRAFDVEVHGLQGISTVDEANLQDVDKLVELLVSRKIKAVFVESSIAPRKIQGLIEACAARGHTVRVGGELYSDAMGPAGTVEGTYVGMQRKNVDTIVEALK